jgi:hypothetical protein
VEAAAGPADDARPEDQRHAVDLDQLGGLEEVDDLRVLLQQIKAVQVVVGDDRALAAGDPARHEVEDLLRAHEIHLAPEHLHALLGSTVHAVRAARLHGKRVASRKEHLNAASDYSKSSNSSVDLTALLRDVLTDHLTV